MTKDLEETLDELGPAARAVVARLKAAPEAEPRASRQVFAPFAPRFGRLAASVSVALLVAAVTIGRIVRLAPGARDAQAAQVKALSPYALAYAPSEAAVEELLRTQAADGSWANDFLTQQNAAALRDVAAANVAYRKAVRYLRSRGLSPLTAEELRARRGQA